MRDAVASAITDADVLVMSAAVADFRPSTPASRKIKKNETRGSGEQGEFSLHLTRNPDILAELADADRESSVKRLRRLIRVGFAAETHDVITHAQAKMAAKRLDLLVANDVSRLDSGFGTDTNKVYLFHANGGVEDLPVMPKTDVATAIWDRVVSLLS
jgi:phosphopantothenoylcysteine decarboxylase/phosphopantothenate--cysteine ligase